MGPFVSRSGSVLDLPAALTQAQQNLTPEQTRIVDALTELVRPSVNVRNPGCCPFTYTGLNRMWRSDPDRYAEVAEYHGWPTSFDPRSRDGRPFCKGAVTFANHRALSGHAQDIARRTLAWTPAPTNTNPVEDDDEDDEEDEEYVRNCQAHVVLASLCDAADA